MSWITTLTGKHFDFINPQADTVCIEDIAGALSNICRFTGHVPEFYSDAQHCVRLSYLVPAEFALECLLHDATEAYCSDINSPLKALLPDYQAIEERVDAVIRAKFGLPPAMSPEVKHADLVMLGTERRDLGLNDGIRWPCLDGIELDPFLITPLPPKTAQAMFINRWNQLRVKSNG